jgi:hypothetical protein
MDAVRTVEQWWQFDKEVHQKNGGGGGGSDLKFIISFV